MENVVRPWRNLLLNWFFSEVRAVLAWLWSRTWGGNVVSERRFPPSDSMEKEKSGNA